MHGCGANYKTQCGKAIYGLGIQPFVQRLVGKTGKVRRWRDIILRQRANLEAYLPRYVPTYLRYLGRYVGGKCIGSPVPEISCIQSPPRFN